MKTVFGSPHIQDRNESEKVQNKCIYLFMTYSYKHHKNVVDTMKQNGLLLFLLENKKVIKDH